MTSAQPARSSSDPPRGCDPRSEPVIKSLFDVRALAAKSAIDAGSLAVLSGVSVGDLLAFERFAIDGAAMLPV